MEGVERRAIILAFAVAFVLVFNTQIASSALSSFPTWKLVIMLITFFCLVLATASIVASLAPAVFVSVSPEQRERFVYFALVFYAIALVAIAILASYSAYDLHQHPSRLSG